MKYLSLIVIFLVSISCTRFLIGEKKLTYDKTTLYIKVSLYKLHKKEKFYIIPFEKMKECRGYPKLRYRGSENGYSFFTIYGEKLKYKDEITSFALPDSVCINKYPNSIDNEYKINKEHKVYKHATIENNKMIIQ